MTIWRRRGRTEAGADAAGPARVARGDGHPRGSDPDHRRRSRWRPARTDAAPVAGASRADLAWAWAGAILAALVSIAVNIEHAAPRIDHAAFSAVLPVMVLISAEQMARRLLGRATWPVMLVVGLAAYSLSAWHTVLLLRAWGEPWPLQITGAVAVDGLAVGSVVALYVAGRPDAAQVDVRTPDTSTPAAEPPPILDAFMAGARTHSYDLTATPPVRTPDVHLANGHARTLVTAGRTPDAQLDADRDVWDRYDTAEPPWTWPRLAQELGCSPDAARKRAGRRTGGRK